MSTHNQVIASPGSNPGASLFHQAQAGCRISLNGLMAKHEGLVQAVVRRQCLGELPFDEALQAGRQGLWRAILGYDPERGIAFSSYAWPSISRAIWRAVKVANRNQSQPLVEEVRLSQPPQAGDPALVWETSMIQAALHHLVDRLPERLHQIITTRYGLNGGQARTYRRIGATPPSHSSTSNVCPSMATPGARPPSSWLTPGSTRPLWLGSCVRLPWPPAPLDPGRRGHLYLRHDQRECRCC